MSIDGEDFVNFCDLSRTALEADSILWGNQWTPSGLPETLACQYLMVFKNGVLVTEFGINALIECPIVA